MITCSEFRKMIRAYVDNELSAADKKKFLDHAAMCSQCALTLREMQYVQKILHELPEVNTTSEFDFRLRSSIRIEQQRLNNPSYRFRLFLREYFKPVIAVPAFVVLFATATVFYNNSNGQGPALVSSSQLTAEDSSTQNEQVIDITDGAGEIVYLHYVLEKIQQNEIDDGVFLGQGQVPVTDYTQSNNVKLVSF